MPIKPIKRQSVSEQVYEQLKHQLLIGEWKPGDKIPSENELAAAFGVSRVTVRQALQKLTTLGLIETKLGEGAFVKEITPGVYMNNMFPVVYLGRDSVVEVMEFRTIIEVGAAALAAERIKDEDIKKLEQYYKKMQANKDNIEKYVEYDLSFHSQLAAATGNSLIIQMYCILQDILRMTIKNITEKNGVELGLKFHNMLIDSMKEHNVEKAREIMFEHVQEALINFKKDQ
ncbi:MAG TPA: FadR/GntR family transcriptional regulator [Defluviitaleaceae bacterium]|jgi:GntR family transcriptional repressor for pyruvate dehydrogenase complex|nr:FadR family transcriptional regulator [Candidatus Epulonipiscium sp.]HOQ38198.1 FadR/GntR family transcriptional regulator [Acetivibrio sp.]HQD51284.1 FadR/GntR family transcriptional regulator [Defluviitaleaceae bacterium]